MITYSSNQDFIDSFGMRNSIALTNLDDANATEINEARLDQNRQSAFSRINGIIANCPTVAAMMPFAATPPILRDLELTITNYLLDQVLPRQDCKDRYDDAIKLLVMIGKCQMSLGLDGTLPGAVIDSGETVRARVYARSPQEFSEALITRY
jgi:phage gp36-like protein